MNVMLHTALDYAARGWRVFPLHGIVNDACTCGRADCGSAGKHPLVRRGLYDATTDTVQLRDWWRRWRSANIGVATGGNSGIVVIDVDLPAASASLHVLTGRLHPTLTGITGGGGLHLIYKCADHALGNSVGGLPGITEPLAGIDLRGNGGYIVVPPSAHRSGACYEWLDPDTKPVASPSWLKQPQRPTVDLEAVTPVTFSGDGTAYGRAALDSALTSLRSALVGQRNHTLNRVAFAMAQLVAGGELLESAVRMSLSVTALSIGLDEDESRMTIDSALSAGARNPRCAPHRLLSS